MFLLVLQVPPDLLVPGGLVGHLYQLALSFPLTSMSTRSSSGGPIPPREIIWILGRPPPPWGSLCPIPFSWVTRSTTICYGDGVFICFIPFFLLGSLSSPPPSSGGPPPPPGGGPLPPPEGKPNCSRHPLTMFLRHPGVYYFAPAQKAFPPSEGLLLGSGCHLLVGDLGLVVPPLFKRQKQEQGSTH